MTRSWVPLSTRREQVRVVLADGPMNQAQIAAALGVRQPAVAKIMGRLMEDGYVVRAPSVRGCGSGPWPARYALPEDRQSRYAADRAHG
jgi:predicted ArsR family transcriptional regulator